MTAPFLVPWWSPFAFIAVCALACRVYQTWPTTCGRRTATASQQPGPRTLVTPPADAWDRATNERGET